MGQYAGKSEVEGGSHRSIHAHVAHHSADEKGADLVCFEALQKIRIPEAVGKVLGYDRLRG
jgi:hypothetical protein